MPPESALNRMGHGAHNVFGAPRPTPPPARLAPVIGGPSLEPSVDARRAKRGLPPPERLGTRRRGPKHLRRARAECLLRIAVMRVSRVERSKRRHTLALRARLGGTLTHAHSGSNATAKRQRHRHKDSVRPPADLRAPSLWAPSHHTAAVWGHTPQSCGAIAMRP